MRPLSVSVSLVVVVCCVLGSSKISLGSSSDGFGDKEVVKNGVGLLIVGNVDGAVSEKLGGTASEKAVCKRLFMGSGREAE